MTYGEAKEFLKLDGRLPVALQGSLQHLVDEAHRVIRLMEVAVSTAKRNELPADLYDAAGRLGVDYPGLTAKQRETVNMALVARLATACGYLHAWDVVRVTRGKAAA